jgi:hypothetical protein
MGLLPIWSSPRRYGHFGTSPNPVILYSKAFPALMAKKEPYSG